MSPFVKVKSGINKGKYKSPSGKVFSSKQMRIYLATKRKGKKK